MGVNLMQMIKLCKSTISSEYEINPFDDVPMKHEKVSLTISSGDIY